MNTYTCEKIIDNCMDCEFHNRKTYYENSWGDEYKRVSICCCRKTDRLVGFEDERLREHTQIPNWCPML